ncbi:[Butirosin acyl-carrier protein]--L-glutamate ligase [Rubripirellula obstinata]|uniref:[Butirosin acyl-carrier protein]--L-glutamate ligase n=1 Tax=Rubripirellula obstinata TaxID=406547 RepID=A0A5B1CQM7_9BACT|nr:hypothetical protein [Rubripirellula obstinata]KAA1261544.1 [Butirosin acyl-carrier protein]--L-glutamate ligase [Rubripirellula obstinata]
MVRQSNETAAPSFIDTAGRLPPMWDRRVIFFANLLSIFFENKEQTKVLSDQVGELDSYSARLIPLVNLLFRGCSGGRNNHLVVERPPDPALCKYLENDLGLSLPELVVLDHNKYLQWGQRLRQESAADLSRIFGEEIDSSKSLCLDGYVTDETLTALASKIGCTTVSTMSGSHDGNNKLLLHRFLADQGLPTLDTVIAESADDISGCADQLSQRGYSSAIVRSQIGASGIGMVKLSGLGETECLPQVPDYFFYEGPCLVQGWLAAGEQGIQSLRSPSTQLFLDETTVYAFDMTEQILSDDSVHEGNESPPAYLDQLPDLRSETIAQAEIVGRWLHRTGYRGPASIDWLVVERSSVKGDVAKMEVFVCEINARVTGATYPSILAKHFHPSGAWLLRNLRLGVPETSAALLQIFESAGHLFHADSHSGILPLNFNFGPDGLVHKGQFICIGDSTEQCHHLLHLAQQDLPGSWNADRD